MKLQDEGPTDGSPTVERWVARADEDNPEARAGALLRQAVLREPLAAQRLAAIRSRLRRDVRRPQRHWALRLAIAVGLVLSGGALTTAGQRYFHLFVPGKAAPVETPRAVGAPRTHAPDRGARAGPDALAARRGPRALAARRDPRTDRQSCRSQPKLEERQNARVTARVCRAGRRDTGAVCRALNRSASPLAQESKLLSEALRKLRQDDDPRGALALLDEHDARFATGTLAAEATLARIEALIRTRRNGDALALLDGAAPSPSGSGRDLLIARAELRAAAGRCAAASADFDLLLKANRPLDAITERGLWGRASCRATADAAGARSDLEDYLTSFPGGRFAAKPGGARRVKGFGVPRHEGSMKTATMASPRSFLHRAAWRLLDPVATTPTSSEGLTADRPRSDRQRSAARRRCWRWMSRRPAALGPTSRGRDTSRTTGSRRVPMP